MFGVAKQTVQRAVDQLRVEGILITKPGSGTYVRGTRRRLNRLSRGRYGGSAATTPTWPPDTVNSSSPSGASPPPPRWPTPSACATAPSCCAAGTSSAPTTPPVEVGASWFLAGDAAGTSLERAEAFGRPLYQEAEEATGRRYVSATDTISARQPSREEAEILQIRPDTPVLHLLHVAYDANRKPIEVAQATWPGPMTTLTEEYRIPARPPDPDARPRPGPGLNAPAHPPPPPPLVDHRFGRAEIEIPAMHTGDAVLGFLEVGASHRPGHRDLEAESINRARARARARGGCPAGRRPWSRPGRAPRVVAGAGERSPRPSGRPAARAPGVSRSSARRARTSASSSPPDGPAGAAAARRASGPAAACRP